MDIQVFFKNMFHAIRTILLMKKWPCEVLTFVIFKIWETELCFEIVNMDVMIKMMLMMLIVIILLLENKKEKKQAIYFSSIVSRLTGI